MKRLISVADAERAGVAPEFPYLERVMPAVDRAPNSDAYRLWRSRDGYRKACRMLRRSGRRILRGEAISSAYYHGLDLARGPDSSAVVVWGEPVLEIHDSHLETTLRRSLKSGAWDALQPYARTLPDVLNDPDAKVFAESSVYDLGALRRQLDDGMLD